MVYAASFSTGSSYIIRTNNNKQRAVCDRFTHPWALPYRRKRPIRRVRCPLLTPSMLLGMPRRGGSKRSTMWKTPYCYPVKCYTPMDSVLACIFTSFCPLPVGEQKQYHPFCIGTHN